MFFFFFIKALREYLKFIISKSCSIPVEKNNVDEKMYGPINSVKYKVKF